MGAAGAPAPERSCVIEDDCTYVVRISPSRDRKRGRRRLRWKVEAYYKGHRKSTLTGTDFAHEDDARECARRLWGDYAAGLHDAPDAPPADLGELVGRYADRKTGKRGRAKAV